jgi:hypothetical protein
VDLSPLVFLGLLLGVPTAVVLRQKLDRDFRLRRLFRDVPLTSLAQAKEGELVKVSGRVRALGPLVEAPVTQRPCAGFSLNIGGLGTEDGPDASPGLSYLRVERAIALALEDGAEVAMLHLDSPVLWLTHPSGETTHLNDPHPTVAALLDEHGVKWRSKFSHKPIVWQETLLQPGDRVTVLGRVRREPGLVGGSGGGYRESPTQLALVGSAEVPIILTNDPRRGAPADETT